MIQSSISAARAASPLQHQEEEEEEEKKEEEEEKEEQEQSVLSEMRLGCKCNAEEEEENSRMSFQLSSRLLLTSAKSSRISSSRSNLESFLSMDESRRSPDRGLASALSCLGGVGGEIKAFHSEWQSK
ncbi:uncharacterized protein LOC144088616 isoform X1 [Stigmatopora argus]